MKRQNAAGKQFFLYLPISRTHFPNLPSKRFEAASRIGNFGDSLNGGRRHDSAWRGGGPSACRLSIGLRSRSNGRP